MSKKFFLAKLVGGLFLVAILCSNELPAQEIPIGTEISPFSFLGFDNQFFIHGSQNGLKADSMGYRYLAEGGFTYDWVPYRWSE